MFLREWTPTFCSLLLLFLRCSRTISLGNVFHFIFVVALTQLSLCLFTKIVPLKIRVWSVCISCFDLSINLLVMTKCGISHDSEIFVYPVNKLYEQFSVTLIFLLITCLLKVLSGRVADGNRYFIVRLRSYKLCVCVCVWMLNVNVAVSAIFLKWLKTFWTQYALKCLSIIFVILLLISWNWCICFR